MGCGGVPFVRRPKRELIGRGSFVTSDKRAGCKVELIAHAGTLGFVLGETLLAVFRLFFGGWFSTVFAQKCPARRTAHTRVEAFDEIFAGANAGLRESPTFRTTGAIGGEGGSQFGRDGNYGRGGRWRLAASGIR
jgi:hypothetical protein